MKKTHLLLSLLLLLHLTTIAQHANKTLDYIQTKDGRKLYGKVKDINPKDGVTFQTYGEGDEIKLKHEEIETIKLAQQKSSASTTDRETYNGFSIATSQLLKPLLPKDTNYVYDFGLNNVGLYYTHYWEANNAKRLSGFSVGYEKSYNFNSATVSLNTRFIKAINKTNVAYIGIGANGTLNIQRVYNIALNKNDMYEWQSTSYRKLGAGINGYIGIGYIRELNEKLKLNIEVNYALNARSVSYYNYTDTPFSQSLGYYDYFNEKRAVGYENLVFRVGIIFK